MYTICYTEKGRRFDQFLAFGDRSVVIVVLGLDEWQIIFRFHSQRQFRQLYNVVVLDQDMS